MYNACACDSVRVPATAAVGNKAAYIMAYILCHILEACPATHSSPPPPITLPSAAAGSSLCAKLRLRRPHAAEDQDDHWRGPCSGCCSCLPCGDHSI